MPFDESRWAPGFRLGQLVRGAQRGGGQRDGGVQVGDDAGLGEGVRPVAWQCRAAHTPFGMEIWNLANSSAVSLAGIASPELLPATTWGCDLDGRARYPQLTIQVDGGEMA